MAVEPVFTFLTARIEEAATTSRGHPGIRVTLLRRVEDFRGEPEVLSVMEGPQDPYLLGRVREALLTLGIHDESDELAGRTRGLALRPSQDAPVGQAQLLGGLLRALDPEGTSEELAGVIARMAERL